MRKFIPELIQEHILPFNWDVKKVWTLECKSVATPRSHFDYLLGLPLWSSKPNMGMLFDISPLEVLGDKSRSPYQYDRVVKADLSWPIDLLEWKGKTWVLDGVHRIAKSYLQKDSNISVRLHNERVIPAIKNGC